MCPAMTSVMAEPRTLGMWIDFDASSALQGLPPTRTGRPPLSVAVKPLRRGLGLRKLDEVTGVQPTNTIMLNNPIANIGLTVSWLGTSCLPLQCLEPMVHNGSLTVVQCTPEPPESTYIAMYKARIEAR